MNDLLCLAALSSKWQSTLYLLAKRLGELAQLAGKSNGGTIGTPQRILTIVIEKLRPDV